MFAQGEFSLTSSLGPPRAPKARLGYLAVAHPGKYPSLPPGSPGYENHHPRSGLYVLPQSTALFLPQLLAWQAFQPDNLNRAVQ